MIDPEAISDAKRALGRQLAATRHAAGLKQQDLAPLIHYGRSTIASAETGYSQGSRTFWARCDHVLGAGGALLRGYDELQTLIRSQQAQVAALMEQRRAAKLRDAAGGTGSEIAADRLSVSVRLDGREVVVPLDRRLLLQAGFGIVLQAFTLDGQPGELEAIVEQAPVTDHLAVTSPAHIDQVLNHLREQWHALVKTDNLLGPRFALAGVLSQLAIIEALLPALRDEPRRQAVQRGAQYAESAAWLYEDSDALGPARYWTAQAMEWAYQANDKQMLAWVVMRRSQQAATARDAAQVIALTQTARRDEPVLAPAMRAAIRVQEAYGHALDGEEKLSQDLLDEAHPFAAGDTVGDAHEGHGSYCTPSYIELQRAGCWLTVGQPKKAIRAYERALPQLPVVYQRDRAAALGRLAGAYVAARQPEQAAASARTALPVARSAGSGRIVGLVRDVGKRLEPHRTLPVVAALLDDLHEDA